MNVISPFLIDLMTFNGIIQSISRYGIKKEQNSVLTRSSFEESLEHFSKVHLFSEKEMIRSVSSVYHVWKTI